MSFTLHPGQVTALLGPSCSGKTTTALALLGDSGPSVRLSGRVSVAGELVVGDGVGAAELAAARRRVRGGVVAYLPQHVSRALHPSRRVGSLLDEVVRATLADHLTSRRPRANPKARAPPMRLRPR